MEKIIQSVAYRSQERKNAMEHLMKRYPVIQKAAIGQSCAGQEIALYRLGKGKKHDLLTAAFHGSEHLTATVSMMLLEELAGAYTDDKTICGIPVKERLDKTALLVVPCVNPDGCEISLCGGVATGERKAIINRACQGDFTHWNANLRGVDLNHNFNAGWQKLREKERTAGILVPGATRFGGYAPESEPETKAIADLCRRVPMERVAALHTQGEVIYWRYGDQTPARGRYLAEAFCRASGYMLEEPCDLAVGGGFKDWFIETFRRPGFTFELGLGKNPLPPEDTGAVYERVKEMLVLFCTLPS